MTFNNRIWFCGIPGSKWSGIDIQIRKALPCDTTDETPERIFYHRANTPGDLNNGHRGSYWGPGMGCGEDWTDFNHMSPEKLMQDIDQVFTGEGYRVIKSHFFARAFNLDYIWNHFPGDYIVLIYREPQKSFGWWSEVMDFSEGHYPDYRPGYRDYNTMRPILWEESQRITDFAIRKQMNFLEYDPVKAFENIPGYKYDVAQKLKKNHSDVYIAIAQVPETK
jgi:hypothetical protein